VSGGNLGKIADNTVSSDDIGTGGVGSDEIADRSLRLADIAAADFTNTVDHSTISAGTCIGVGLSKTEADLGDITLIFPTPGHDSRLIPYSDPVIADNNPGYRLCNISNVDINPPQETYRFLLLRP